MSNDDLLVPLFPLTGVLLPFGQMCITATEEPYLSLLTHCNGNEELFCASYFEQEPSHSNRIVQLQTENGIQAVSPDYDIGCLASITAYDAKDTQISCEIAGHRRMQLRSKVTAEGISFDFANGEILRDTQDNVRQDLKESLLTDLKALLAENEEVYASVANVSTQELDEGLSFIVAGLIIPDDTPEGNAFRMALLRKKSETKRMRMLRSYIAQLAKAA